MSKIEFYRVIFGWKGKPITGYCVSEPMIYEVAIEYIKMIESKDYPCELVKIMDR